MVLKGPCDDTGVGGVATAHQPLELGHEGVAPATEATVKVTGYGAWRTRIGDKANVI